MKTRRRLKKFHFEKFEYFIFAGLLILFVMPVFMNITLKSKIYQLNIEIEQMSEDIAEQHNINQSYLIELQEMTSFENISKIANEYGLVLENDSTFVLKGTNND